MNKVGLIVFLVLILTVTFTTNPNYNNEVAADSWIVTNAYYIGPHEHEGYYVDKDYRIYISWFNYDNQTSLDDLNVEVTLNITLDKKAPPGKLKDSFN